MSKNENEASEIQNLQNRVAALEATVASLHQTVANLAAAADGAPNPAGTAATTSTLDAGWKTYTPKLMGEKADPFLGDGSNPKPRAMQGIEAGQNGHYCQIGRLVVVKTWIQFISGAKPGEGQYRMTLPVPALVASDAWLGPTGVVLMHQDTTNIIRIGAVNLTHSDWVSFQLDNSTQPVSHVYPWLWDDGDGFNTFIVYEAAGDE